MGLCIDTVLCDVHNTATSAVGLTTATTATGDSLTVRSFSETDWAKLESIFVQGSSAQQARILSPRLHDNVTGITVQTAETPSEFLFPPDTGTPLYSSDTLVVQLAAAASSDTVAALLIYYKNIKGIDADLRMWEQVAPKMGNLKIAEVAVTTSGTIGAWTDTVITTTENQYKADHEYAVLGFQSSAALAVQAIKGPSTGNLRVGCPGATSTLDITSYFLEMSVRHRTPHIPVFKANDRANTYVSTAANTASVSANVYMVLADLGTV